MNSTFEVYYFPFQLRGELIRLILAYAGANWSNKNVVDWPKEKFSTEGLLYTQVPMLTEIGPDGSKFHLVQSNAIIHYLANKFNLYPSDPKKKALIDSYYEGIEENKNKVTRPLAHSKPEEYDEIVKGLHDPNNDIFKFLKINEFILAKNHNGNGYYMDEQVTFVDICAYNFVVTVNGFPGMNNYINRNNAPNLMKVYDTINKNANIQAYKKDLKKHLPHSRLNPTPL